VKRQVEEAKTALRKARRQDRKLRAERDNEAWEAFHRTADRCYYCGEVLTEGVGEGQRAPPTMRTRDHLIPRSRGGPTHPLNLVHACAGCNARKANRTLEEYRHALVSRGHGGVFWGEEREARKAA
jgi:5-methylcytosine-specific restriction endonuclease McrA